MLRQCPVLHNPDKAEDQIPLESVARPLYKAQAQVAMAAVKLLGGAKATKVQRRGKSAFILGEIGSGKTQCSLAVANTIDAKSILVMCPPHLLNSWQDQINAVVPWYENYILSDINDVIAFGWYSAIIKLSLFTFLAGWFSCFAYVLLLRWIRSVGEAPEPVSNSFAEEDI
jgi:hypothetical protein